MRSTSDSYETAPLRSTTVSYTSICASDKCRTAIIQPWCKEAQDNSTEHHGHAILESSLITPLGIRWVTTSTTS